MNILSDFFFIPDYLDFTTNSVILCAATFVMLLVCVKFIISNDLLESLVLSSIFSLILSLCYLLMDAPDVAMTETALGACLSSCVILNLIKIWGRDVKSPQKLRMILAIILCILLAIALVWSGMDLPLYGDENSAMQQHVSKYYIQNTAEEIAIPSFVAAILASYRGYDTLGETSVILIAAIAVFMILSRQKVENEEKQN